MSTFAICLYLFLAVTTSESEPEKKIHKTRTGLMMLKTDVDSRIRTAVSGGPPAYPTHAYTPTRGGEV